MEDNNTQEVKTQDSSNNQQQNKKGKAKKTLLIVVLVFLMGTITTLAAVCVKLYQASIAEPQTQGQSEGQQQTSVSNSNSNVSSILVSDDNRNLLQDIKDKVAEGSIIIKMSAEQWIFTDGCTVSNAYLANSERNDFSMCFEISLADTGEVLLRSPEVPVGACIQNFGLDRALEPGTYEVVIAHRRMKDGKAYGNVQTAATIIVQ